MATFTMTAHPANDTSRARYFYFALFFACSFGLHTPHLISYVGDVNYDLFIHYNWAKEFAENFLAGDPYPRWSFLGHYELGEPVFITYSPIYYYLVAFLRASGIGTWISMQIIAIVCDALFACFVFAASARFVSQRVAGLIALVALLNPFLVFLHYKFHGLAWAATGYLTHGMLLWALLRPEAKKPGLNAWAALAIALAVGTHTVSALVNLICYSFFSLARASRWAGDDRQTLPQAIVSWGLTAGTGLLLSAVYLYPAIHYLKIMNVESWVGEYRLENFAWPVVTFFTNKPQWLGVQWAASAPALAMFVMAAVYFVKFRPAPGRLTTPLVLVLAGAAASVFFASELSYPLWIFQNPISQINLPFRFVSLSYTLTAVAMGLTLVHAQAAGRRRWAIGLAGMMGLSILFGVAALLKGAYADGKPLMPEMRNEQYTYGPAKARFSSPGYLERCSGNKAECVRHDLSSGSFAGLPEYRLMWASAGSETFAHRGFAAYCQDHAISCSEPRRQGSGIDVMIGSNKPVAVTLPIFYYPAWQVTVSGKEVAVDAAPESGLLRVPVEAGNHEVSVRWKTTDIEKTGQRISLVTLLLLALYLAVSGLRRKIPE
ncbi:hypothetical protein [Zoogloea sp.]|uniref:hypothetical protein n=1 Tax=Zoogloea sp. TaxID=49181 RepID=UPI002C542AE5|nr:hypothetical protein [Zoogloea sp.]HQA10633.1 hypothetical protein [Zoogloea sp.]